MYKELVISIIIVIAIFCLNKVTQDNTESTIAQVTEKLQMLRNDVLKGDIDNTEANNKAKEAYDKWEELDDIMAYYIEHDEIEKVTTLVTSIKSFTETEEYAQVVEGIDKCIYILEHIEEREKIKLDNIF